MSYGYSYEIKDLVVPSSPYETRKLHIGIIIGINRLDVSSPLHPGSTKYKVYWLTSDGRCVILWHVGGELKMISPHEGFQTRYRKYRR
jgi:hypothetical protein